MPKTNPKLRVVVDSRTYFITRASDIIDAGIMQVYSQLVFDRKLTARGKTKPTGIVSRVGERNIQVSFL